MEQRKMTKIDIITRPEKLEELKDALNKIGVVGMTVSQVYGCGTQGGHREVYRRRQSSKPLPGGERTCTHRRT